MCVVHRWIQILPTIPACLRKGLEKKWTLTADKYIHKWDTTRLYCPICTIVSWYLQLDWGYDKRMPKVTRAYLKTFYQSVSMVDKFFIGCDTQGSEKLNVWICNLDDASSDYFFVGNFSQVLRNSSTGRRQNFPRKLTFNITESLSIIMYEYAVS